MQSEIGKKKVRASDVNLPRSKIEYAVSDWGKNSEWLRGGMEDREEVYV
jgi:hypothetical protein